MCERTHATERTAGSSLEEGTQFAGPARTILSAARPRPPTDGARASGDTSLAAKRRLSCLPDAKTAWSIAKTLGPPRPFSVRNSISRHLCRSAGCHPRPCQPMASCPCRETDEAAHCCKLGPPGAEAAPPAEVPAGCRDAPAPTEGGAGGVGAAAAAALGTDPGPSPTAAGSPPLRLRAENPAARGVGSPSRLFRAGLVDSNVAFGTQMARGKSC